jgi:hypothetical protein
MNDDEMGGSCCTYGGDEKYVHSFSRKLLGHQGVNRGMILKWILKK